MPEIDKLFDIATKHQASDLLLKVGANPILRLSGTLRELDAKAFTEPEIRKLVFGMLSTDQIKHFEDNGDLDMAYTTETGGRFRVNLFRQRGATSMVARRVNMTIPSFNELHLPPILEKIAGYQQGMVLVCGVTGSGKSTTLAAIIQYINASRRCHIITIEDPIEYMYTDQKSVINQREVGLDVKSFKIALKSVVRQNPDVILIGEMRDAETFATAIEAAATGHLVFGTLHSSTVPQTFSRIFDIFPPEERDSARKSLVFNLRAVVCQKLALAKDGKGRVPVNEVMIMTPAVQKLLEEGGEKKIGDVIRAYEADGMFDFNQCLYRLIKENMISEKTALTISHNPDQLRMNIKGIFIANSGITN